MIIKEKIGDNSILRINGELVDVTIRHSPWSLLWLLAFPVLIGYFAFLNAEGIPGIIHLFFACVPVVVFIYRVGQKEENNLNLKTNEFKRIKSWLGLTIKKTEFEIEKSSRFKYEIEYGSYNSITAIWLVSYTDKYSRKTMRFHTEKSFKKFQKIFNKTFPDRSILQWHD